MMPTLPPRLTLPHRPPHPSGRLLKETAISTASGGQSASASAQAGPGFAQTQQSATGANSQVQGISQARLQAAEGQLWVLGAGPHMPTLVRARAVAAAALPCQGLAVRAAGLASLNAQRQRCQSLLPTAALRVLLLNRPATAACSVDHLLQVGQKVDVCQRGPANSAECQTLTTAGKLCRAEVP